MRSHHQMTTLLLSTALLAAGCGSTDFAGSTGKKNNADATPEEESTDAGGDDGDPVDPDGGSETPIGVTDFVTEAFVADSATVVAPADIIFLVDTSGSMSDETARLEQNMEAFLTKFVAGAGADFQLFLVGQGFQFPAAVTSAPRVELINEGVGSHDALDVVEDLFNQPAAGQVLQFRPDAAKEIVVVTDDEAEGDGIAAIQSRILSAALAGSAPVRVHGLIGLTGGFNSATCTIAGVGNNYQALSLLSKPAGLIQDLCLDDYNKLLANLGTTIAAPKALTFPLTKQPDPAEPIVASFDGTALTADQFTYDPDTNSVTIAAGVVPAGKTVEIRYLPLP